MSNGEPTNNDRAERARGAVRLYARELYSRCDPWENEGDEEENIGDLLTDLHHLADSCGLDWERVLRMAERNYEAEAEEEEA